MAEQRGPADCDDSRLSASSVERLNRTCYCVGVDTTALQGQLETDLGVRGLSHALLETHPHLFAALPVFVARDHLEQMASVIAAVETVVATPAFRRAAMAGHRTSRASIRGREAGCWATIST